METYNENATLHILLYVNNSREIYCQTEQLYKSLARRMKQGKAVEAGHLADSATMRNIINAGARMAASFDGVTASAADKAQARKEHAEYCIETAEYIARHGA